MSFFKMFTVLLLTVSLVPMASFATDWDEGDVDTEIADRHTSSDIDSGAIEGKVKKQVKKPKAKKARKKYKKSKHKHKKKMMKKKKKKKIEEEM